MMSPLYSQHIKNFFSKQKSNKLSRKQIFLYILGIFCLCIALIVTNHNYSLYKKPINRNYYLVSVYDADTNRDTLINRFDLRRFYYFDASATEKIQLLPPDYSAIRSQYDPKNDVMYIFARHDENHDGKTGYKEPLHIFWVDLKAPRVAKRMY